MPIKTRGLVHTEFSRETESRYGRTVCGLSYTQDISLVEALGRLDRPISEPECAEIVAAPVSCLQCLAVTTGWL